MERDPIATTVALKNAVQKATRIKELGLTPDMSQEDIDRVITDLATAKALISGQKMSGFISGQEWYVNSLIAFSKLSSEEKLEAEYKRALIETAGFDEGVSILDEI